MPRINPPSKNVVTFTASEVWAALRKTYPEAGMPVEYNPSESGNSDAPQMHVACELEDVRGDFNRDDANFSFDEDAEGIVVTFVPQPKGK